MARTDKPYSDIMTWNSFLEWSKEFSQTKNKKLTLLLNRYHIEDWCYENKYKMTKHERKHGIWCIPYETFGNCDHYRCKRQRLSCHFLSYPEIIPGRKELESGECKLSH